VTTAQSLLAIITGMWLGCQIWRVETGAPPPIWLRAIGLSMLVGYVAWVLR